MSPPVKLFENPNFTGRSIELHIGEHRFYTPDDFNDVAASIQVAPGHVALIYEHADEVGGYGISVDLMEDCSDLAVYGMSKQVSYVTVFASTHPATRHIWVRGKGSGDSYVPGHWERPRASGESPNAPVGAVSPPIPSRAPRPPTTLHVSGSTVHITTLGSQDPTQASRWENAVANQFGVVGSDFRGSEPIGSAAFERDPNNWKMKSAGVGYVNFWYPQKQPRDHRENLYFKRTCIGTVDHTDIADHDYTYKDQDVDIYIIPDEPHMYLIRDAHPREYTDIMSVQWHVTGGGKQNCDDEAGTSGEEFRYVEAEIHPSMDLGSGVAEGLRDRINAIPDKQIGVYGPWIYDRGHCCHPEIHPAEQIWWRQADASATTYYLNIICDASKRFWWRDQMDGDDKRKPWAAPPITGVFAIAFEVAQPGPRVAAPLDFVVTDISRHNAQPKSDRAKRYLIYEGKTLVRFIPNSDAFEVSFEEVGLGDNGRIRGFLVLEVTVGRLSQILIDPPKFPAGIDVNALDEGLERKVFDKQEGHYMFTVIQRRDDSLPVG